MTLQTGEKTEDTLDRLEPSRIPEESDYDVDVRQVVAVEVREGRGGPDSRRRANLGVGINRSTGRPAFGLVEEYQAAVGRGSETRYSMVGQGQIGLSADNATSHREVGSRLAERIDDGVSFDGAYTRSSMISGKDVTRALQELRVPADVPHGVEMPSLYDHYDVAGRLAESEADMRAQLAADDEIEDRLAVKEQQAIAAEPELAGYMAGTDDLQAARQMLRQETTHEVDEPNEVAGGNEAEAQDAARVEAYSDHARRTERLHRELFPEESSDEEYPGALTDETMDEMARDDQEAASAVSSNPRVAAWSEDLDRLRGAVDQFNPHNPAQVPRIERLSSFIDQQDSVLSSIAEIENQGIALGTVVSDVYFERVDEQMDAAMSFAGVRSQTGVKPQISTPAAPHVQPTFDQSSVEPEPEL